MAGVGDAHASTRDRRGSTEHDHDNLDGASFPATGSAGQLHRNDGRVLRLPDLRNRCRPGLSEVVLSRRVTSGGIAVVVRHFWCRVHRPPPWRDGVRALRRPHRTQTDAGVLPAPDGRCDRADGAAAHLRADRSGRPNPVDALATRAGLCRRRRVGRRHTHGRRACARATKGALRGLPADGRPGGHRPGDACLLVRVPAARRAVPRVGMAHTVSGQRRADRHRAGDSPVVVREPGLRRTA